MLQKEARKSQVAEEKAERLKDEAHNSKARIDKIRKECEELKKLNGAYRID